MFSGNVIETAVKIQVDDLDVGGVVYHANYLRLCERVRNDLFEVEGASFQNLFLTDTVLAVVDAKIAYRRPVRLGSAFIYTKLVDWTAKSLTLAHAIRQTNTDRLESERKDMRKIAESGVYCEVTLLAASLKEGRAVNLPESLQVRLAERP